MDEKELERLREAIKTFYEIVENVYEFIRETVKAIVKCLPELQQMEEQHRKEQVRLVMKNFEVPKLSNQVMGKIPKMRPVARNNC